MRAHSGGVVKLRALQSVGCEFESDLGHRNVTLGEFVHRSVFCKTKQHFHVSFS